MMLAHQSGHGLEAVPSSEQAHHVLVGFAQRSLPAIPGAQWTDLARCGHTLLHREPSEVLRLLPAAAGDLDDHMLEIDGHDRNDNATSPSTDPTRVDLAKVAMIGAPR